MCERKMFTADDAKKIRDEAMKNLVANAKVKAGTMWPEVEHKIRDAASRGESLVSIVCNDEVTADELVAIAKAHLFDADTDPLDVVIEW